MTLSIEEFKNIENQVNELVKKEKLSEPKVSVIIPTYNNEKYISKCLFSLINQTLSDIEIIVVNDGSKDDTEKILSLFAEKDKRIKVINQDNQMQGAARNNGLKIACGEYIGFVDSDDWVDLDYYEKLYNAAKKYDSDLALATNIRTENGKNKKRISIVEEKYYTDLQAKVDITRLWKDGCPTNKIYRKTFLDKFEIRYPEGVYCEDKIFTTKSVFFANGIVTVPEIYYYYYRNPDSTVNIPKKRQKKSRQNDKENARREVLDFLKEQKAQLRDKNFWAIKKELRINRFLVYMIKESLHSEKHFLFGIIPIFEKNN